MVLDLVVFDWGSKRSQFGHIWGFGVVFGFIEARHNRVSPGLHRGLLGFHWGLMKA